MMNLVFRFLGARGERGELGWWDKFTMKWPTWFFDLYHDFWYWRYKHWLTLESYRTWLDKRWCKIGTLVCDCRYKHLKVVSVDYLGDEAILEDGMHCSIGNCIGPATELHYCPDHKTIEKLLEGTGFVSWEYDPEEFDEGIILYNAKGHGFVKAEFLPSGDTRELFQRINTLLYRKEAGP